MIDAELWAAARRVDLDREAARIQLVSRARKLATAGRRARSRRNNRDGPAPESPRQTRGLDVESAWAESS